MKSGSYWSFRESGALGEIDFEPEPYEPFRCNCGAFLSPGKFSVQTFEEEPGKEDAEFGFLPGRPKGEVFIWPCKKCKKGRVETYYT